MSPTTIITRKILKATFLFYGGIGLVCATEAQLVKRDQIIKPQPTHDDIAKRQEPRRLAADKKEIHRNEVIKTAERKKRGEGLLNRSSIISSSYDWTIVPKGAVLHVPKLYAKRVNGVRNGKLTGWQDFYGKNRRWIRAVPVTIEQASGKNPLAVEFLDSLKKSDQVLVAVCQGGPISVKLPTADESADPALAAADAEKAAKKSEQEAKALEELKRRLLSRPR